MRAIAAAVGPHCEVVLHDLGGREVDLQHSIIAIENGHVSGRRVGGPSTNLGIDVLHDEAKDHDALGYRARTVDGRELRSSSVYFRNGAGRVVAALCINVDISSLRQVGALVESLLPDPSDATGQPQEIVGQDIDSVLDQMIAEAIEAAGRPGESLSRDERIKVIAQLDKQGALRVKKSMERIANMLGISRVTAYAYLDQARTIDGVLPARSTR